MADKGTERSDASLLPQVQRSALSDDVYAAVREHILRGHLPPDSRVVEERLSQQLGVSRAPLREAIWQLKADGLIVGQGRGTRVVALSQRDIRELHLLRVTLETTLYQNAATIITSDDTAALERIIRKMELVSASGRSGEKIAQLDFEFHQRLCQIPDLPKVFGIWEDQHVLFRLWLNLVVEAHDDPTAIAEHHRVLLEAVNSGDARRIAVETSHHIYAISKALVTERRRWEIEHAEMIGDPYGIAARKTNEEREED